MSWIEWGVMVDRRSSGLGIMLATTCSRRADAERDAVRVGETYPDYPVIIQWREVVKTEWKVDAMDGMAHWPACNDRCNELGHWLLADPPAAQSEPAHAPELKDAADE